MEYEIRKTLLPTIDTASELIGCTFFWCRFVSAKQESLTFATHKHMVAEIHFVIKGELTFYFNQNVTVKEGEFIFIRAGCSHAIYNSNPKTLKLVIGFTVDEYHPRISSVLYGKSAPIPYSANDVMLSLIEAIWQKSAQRNHLEKLSVRHLMNSIVFEMVDMLYNPADLPSKQDVQIIKADQRMEQMQEFIGTHIFDQIRGEDVASSVRLGIRQADRICHQFYGYSVNQWIIRERIRRIKDLLETTDYTLSDLSEISGFSNVYSFIRHFKTYTGKTPGGYRKERQKHKL